MKMRLLIITLLGLLLCIPVMAQEELNVQGGEKHVYKTVDDVALQLYVFQSEEKSDTSRPAIVFFFGGGWRGGNPNQFRPQCMYLSERGMVSITVEYRVSSRHGVKANACVEDAKSAIRWVRKHAEQLGVDPERIVAGGGSAGGHLAACTGTIEGFEAEGEDHSISSKPNAMALFNPAVVLAPVPEFDIPEKRLAGLPARLGVEPLSLSPYHHLKEGVAPTIIFHGTADTTVPFASVEVYAKKMRELKNRCILEGYANEPHGFFNFGKKDNVMFIRTVTALDAFLSDLGYIDGEPHVEAFAKTYKK